MVNQKMKENIKRLADTNFMVRCIVTKTATGGVP